MQGSRTSPRRPLRYHAILLGVLVVPIIGVVAVAASCQTIDGIQTDDLGDGGVPRLGSHDGSLSGDGDAPCVVVREWPYVTTTLEEGRAHTWSVFVQQLESIDCPDARHVLVAFANEFTYDINRDVIVPSSDLIRHARSVLAERAPACAAQIDVSRAVDLDLAFTECPLQSVDPVGSVSIGISWDQYLSVWYAEELASRLLREKNDGLEIGAWIAFLTGLADAAPGLPYLLVSADDVRVVVEQSDRRWTPRRVAMAMSADPNCAWAWSDSSLGGPLGRRCPLNRYVLWMNAFRVLVRRDLVGVTNSSERARWLSVGEQIDRLLFRITSVLDEQGFRTNFAHEREPYADPE